MIKGYKIMLWVFWPSFNHKQHKKNLIEKKISIKKFEGFIKNQEVYKIEFIIDKCDPLLFFSNLKYIFIKLITRFGFLWCG